MGEAVATGEVNNLVQLANIRNSRRGFARGSLHGKHFWLARMVLIDQ